MEINKNTLLAELFEREEYKRALEALGVPCFSCPFFKEEASYLTVGEVCERFNLDFKKLIKELKLASKKYGRRKTSI